MPELRRRLGRDAVTWRASGPTPDVAPTASTDDPCSVLTWAEQRARFYGAACIIQIDDDGAACVVAVLRPEVAPEGQPVEARAA